MKMTKNEDLLGAILAIVMVGAVIGAVSAMVFIAMTQVIEWAFIKFAFMSVCMILAFFLFLSITLKDFWKILIAIAIVTLGLYLLVYERVVWLVVVDFVAWMQTDILVNLGVIIIIVGMVVALIVLGEEYISNRERKEPVG